VPARRQLAELYCDVLTAELPATETRIPSPFA
jgi:hypothetical protein